MRVVISFLIFGIAILMVSAGLLFLTEAQIDKRPVNPVSPMLISENRNLKQTKEISQVGLLVGAVTVALSATTSSVLYWRDH